MDQPPKRRWTLRTPEQILLRACPPPDWQLPKNFGPDFAYDEKFRIVARPPPQRKHTQDGATAMAAGHQKIIAAFVAANGGHAANAARPVRRPARGHTHDAVRVRNTLAAINAANRNFWSRQAGSR